VHAREALIKASNFEFRYRAALIAGIFTLGFWAYAIDHINIVRAIVSRAVNENSAHALLLTHSLYAFATLLVALAAWIRTWGAAYLSSKVVHDSKLHAGVLVADGPYRYVRHPLYLGGILCAPGIGLMASRLGFFIIVGGLTLLYLRLAGREESELQGQHGAAFAEFRRRVPCLWPSVTPRLPKGSTKAHWGQAFRGEAFMWGFAIAMATFAVTLNLFPSGIIMAAALLVFLEQQFVHNRRRRAAAAAQPQPKR
jgi:protein-S-isoprenylcysteine O-methyltransferase Ste14